MGVMNAVKRSVMYVPERVGRHRTPKGIDYGRRGRTMVGLGAMLGYAIQLAILYALLRWVGIL